MKVYSILTVDSNDPKIPTSHRIGGHTWKYSQCTVEPFHAMEIWQSHQFYISSGSEASDIFSQVIYHIMILTLSVTGIATLIVLTVIQIVYTWQLDYGKSEWWGHSGSVSIHTLGIYEDLPGIFLPLLWRGTLGLLCVNIHSGLLSLDISVPCTRVVYCLSSKLVSKHKYLPFLKYECSIMFITMSTSSLPWYL